MRLLCHSQISLVVYVQFNAFMVPSFMGLVWMKKAELFGRPSESFCSLDLRGSKEEMKREEREEKRIVDARPCCLRLS